MSEPASPVFPLREVAVFGSIVSALLLLANALVCATWSYFFSLPGWIVWQIVPGAVAIAFIPATILRFRSTHPALRIVYALSAAWVGGLNFAFFASMACWDYRSSRLSMTAWPLSRFSIATILFGLALMVTVYGLINAAWLRTSRVTVKLRHLPAAWQGRTVALVTDLHLGPLSGSSFLRRVLARLRHLKPDAVFHQRRHVRRSYHWLGRYSCPLE